MKTFDALQLSVVLGQSQYNSGPERFASAVASRVDAIVVESESENDSGGGGDSGVAVGAAVPIADARTVKATAVKAILVPMEMAITRCRREGKVY